MQWIKMPVFDSDFVRETDKAILIRIPYTELTVWIPKKMVKKTKTAGVYKLVMPTDMVFRIILHAKVLGECTSTELRELLSGDKQVLKRKWKEIRPEKELKSHKIHHRPVKIEPVRREADDSLKR